MQIKKYIAATLKDAKEEMKAELGDEAIVLSIKVIEAGGSRGQKMFEITAGMDTLPASKQRPLPRPAFKTAAAEPEQPADVDRALEALRMKIYQAKNQTDSAPVKQMPDDERQAVRKIPANEQPRELKRPAPANNPYAKTVPQPGRQPAKETQPAKPKPVPAIKDNMGFEAENLPRAQAAEQKTRQRPGGAGSFLLENVKHGLMEKDIQPAIVNQLIGQLTANVPFLKPADIDSSVISTIATMIPCSGFEINKRKSGKIISVVGPTGVGKTTCIAKLAVISKLLHKLDIGLISVDTYRLGAIDQLKIFSEISDIDFLVAYEAKELPTLVNKFKNKDIIFLDTAGRSQNNAKHLQEMKAGLASVNISETILVLNAAAATATLLDTAKKFALFNYTGLIFTKLDEAVTYGNLINVVHKYNVPIKYLTNGQVIPDDIIAADSEHIANIIYSGKVVQA